MTHAEKGKVYLVGAGPGDPELLTRKAASLLRSSDVIYHDDLVPQAVLDEADASAMVISVGKRCGAKRVTQEEINERMIATARLGLSVVRLKSGDPLIFGRAREELDALAAAGVPCEVVPGISAAGAAAAALGCSLTDRSAASSVLLSTGHHAQTLNPNLRPTRVVYMPGPDLASYASAWLAEGDSPDMPCALVSRVSQPDERVTRTTLAQLPKVEPPAAPALLLAGWALHHARAIDLNASSASRDEAVALCK